MTTAEHEIIIATPCRDLSASFRRDLLRVIRHFHANVDLEHFDENVVIPTDAHRQRLLNATPLLEAWVESGEDLTVCALSYIVAAAEYMHATGEGGREGAETRQEKARATRQMNIAKRVLSWAETTDVAA